jgi:membrane-bound lytic murein transglycosylase MltF
MMVFARYIYVQIAGRDFGEIKSSGIIRIATEYNAIGFYVAGDSISGFQHELTKMLEKRFHIRIETHPVMSLEESMKGLSEKKYDIIARPIPVTSELRQHFLLTTPILLNKQVLVQRKSPNLIRNQIHLGKKTIYVSKKSPALLRIRNLSNEIGDTIYVIEEEKYSDEQLITMVAKGAIDYAVCDESLANKKLQLYPNIDISTDISFTQLQAWMVRKSSPALLDSLNVWILEIKKTEEFRQLYRKYYRPE